MTAGVLAAFFLLLGQFYGPVQQLSGIVDAWQQATASGKHIDELLATEGTENLRSSSVLPVTVHCILMRSRSVIPTVTSQL